MQPATQLHREAWPPTAGGPGIVQGHYGAAGNLELVACAVDDGLWVGWFNTDPTDDGTGAARLSWSGALRFAHGHRYVAARITQATAGPDFLEVLARTADATLRRHVWTPETGFVDHGELAGAVTASTGIVVEAGGAHRVYVADTQGIWLLRGEPGPAYPALDFTTEPAALPPVVGVRAIDAARHDDHVDVLVLDGSGMVLLACPLAAAGEWIPVTRAAAAAALAIDAAGQGIAVVALDGSATLLTRSSVRDTWDCVELPGAPVGVAGSSATVALATGVIDGAAEWQVLLGTGQKLRHLRVRGQEVFSAVVRAEVHVTHEVATCHRER